MQTPQIQNLSILAYGAFLGIILSWLLYHVHKFFSKSYPAHPGSVVTFHKLKARIDTADAITLLIMPGLVDDFRLKWFDKMSKRSIVYMLCELHTAMLNRKSKLAAGSFQNNNY